MSMQIDTSKKNSNNNEEADKEQFLGGLLDKLNRLETWVKNVKHKNHEF